MKRLVTVLVIVMAVLGAFAGTAAAHIRVVDAPGNPDPGWVGSPAEGIPGQGEGLVQGGPTGTTTLSPAHAGGLNTACEAIRAQGKAAVDIYVLRQRVDAHTAP